MLPCTYDTVARLVCGTAVCMRARAEIALPRGSWSIYSSHAHRMCQMWLHGGCSMNHPVAHRFGMVIARATRPETGIVHHVKHCRSLVSVVVAKRRMTGDNPARTVHIAIVSPAALQGWMQGRCERGRRCHMHVPPSSIPLTGTLDCWKGLHY